MTLKAIGSSLFLFAMFCGVIGIVTPSGRTEKMMKYVIAVASVSLIVLLITDIEISFPKTEEITSTYSMEESMLREAESIAESKISKILFDEGNEVIYLKINMDISEDESIRIISVEYTPSNKNKSEEIIKRIKELTGSDKVEEKL